MAAPASTSELSTELLQGFKQMGNGIASSEAVQVFLFFKLVSARENMG
jgi:hypothetical protein